MAHSEFDPLSCCGGIAPLAGLNVAECKSSAGSEGVLHYGGTAVWHYLLEGSKRWGGIYTSRDHWASPASALWITFPDKWPLRQGHLHFPSNPPRALCVRVSGLVFSPLINGVYYSVLLNFISSGPLQDIEQALSFLPLSPPVAARLWVCACEFVCACPRSSAARTHLSAGNTHRMRRHTFTY